ncbi:MAG: hypothetical protein M0P31_09760 [Solirubrobacteraceae bacterium]|nr:hypothetical protein [Solirubrobacteraceae bacterium]
MTLGTAVVGAVGIVALLLATVAVGIAWSAMSAINGGSGDDAGVLVAASLGAVLLVVLGGMLLAVGWRDLCGVLQGRATTDPTRSRIRLITGIAIAVVLWGTGSVVALIGG